MGRRHTVDDATAAIATQRLAGLLADLGPRRAVAAARDVPDADSGLGGRRSNPEGDDPDSVRHSGGEADSAPDRRGPSAGSLPAHALSFGRRHLAVLLVVLLIGLGAGGWALLRARPVAEAAPLTVLTTSAPPSSSSSAEVGVGSGAASPSTAPGSPTTAATIVVHVMGAVRRPGVVTLAERARVMDAIEASGGLRGDARPAELNLAQVVQDGQQIVVGTTRHPRGEVRDAVAVPGSSSGGPGAGAGGSGAGSGRSTASTVDLNTATLTQLDTLPGVGPVTAERILAWRMEHGTFSRVEELQEVDGIGPKTYAQIAPHVRV